MIDQFIAAAESFLRMEEAIERRWRAGPPGPGRQVVTRVRARRRRRLAVLVRRIRGAVGRRELLQAALGPVEEAAGLCMQLQVWDTRMRDGANTLAACEEQLRLPGAQAAGWGEYVAVHFDGCLADRGDIEDRLGSQLNLLDDLAHPPEAAPAASPQGPGAPGRGKGKRIDGRMRKLLDTDSACLEWGVRQWARHLGCSVSTVQGTPTWETIRSMRVMRQVEAVTRRKTDQHVDGRRVRKKKRPGR
jgi:hypothetical protein